MGRVPSRASASEKMESGVAILISHASANYSPTETHDPERNATSGTRRADKDVAGSGETAAGSKSSAGPEQKSGAEALRTATLGSRSSRSCSQI